MVFRNILAEELENRGALSNPYLAAMLRDPDWIPDKDSLWTVMLRAMTTVYFLDPPDAATN